VFSAFSLKKRYLQTLRLLQMQTDHCFHCRQNDLPGCTYPLVSSSLPPVQEEPAGALPVDYGGRKEACVHLISPAARKHRKWAA
jgi:hypothetical protein